MSKKFQLYGSIIILIGIISFIIFQFRYKIKFTMNELTGKDFNTEDAKQAILAVQDEYGTDMARIVEKIMRLETAHFTSTQYKKTGSAGMEAGHWKNLPDNVTTIDFKDAHDGHIGHFIVWDSVTDFAKYLANYINEFNGNFARWNSTNPDKQKQYADAVNKVSTKFV